MSESDDVWVCPRCTMDNSSLLYKCHMCDSDREEVAPAHAAAVDIVNIARALTEEIAFDHKTSTLSMVPLTGMTPLSRVKQEDHGGGGGFSIFDAGLAPAPYKKLYVRPVSLSLYDAELPSWQEQAQEEEEEEEQVQEQQRSGVICLPEGLDAVLGSFPASVAHTAAPPCARTLTLGVESSTEASQPDVIDLVGDAPIPRDTTTSDARPSPPRWLRLTVEEESVRSPQPLKLLLPTTLEVVKNRALEALDLWDAEQTLLEVWTATATATATVTSEATAADTATEGDRDMEADNGSGTKGDNDDGDNDNGDDDGGNDNGGNRDGDWEAGGDGHYSPVHSVASLCDGAQLRLQVLERLTFDDVQVEMVAHARSIEAAYGGEGEGKDPALLQALEPRFLGSRHVRGDGNCFYRALIFQLLLTHCRRAEHAQPYRDDEPNNAEMNRRLRSLGALLSKLQSTRGLSAPDQDVISELAQELQLVLSEVAAVKRRVDSDSPVPSGRRKRYNVVPQRLRGSFNAEDGSVDAALVRATRLCIGNYLLDKAALEEREQEKGEEEGQKEGEKEPAPVAAEEIRLTDVVAAGGMSVPDFVQDIVLCEGRDAEDVIVAFASRVFDMRLSVWHVHGGECAPLLERQEEEEEDAADGDNDDEEGGGAGR